MREKCVNECVSGQFTLTYCPSVLFSVPQTSLQNLMASHLPKSFPNFSYTSAHKTPRTQTHPTSRSAHTQQIQTHAERHDRRSSCYSMPLCSHTQSRSQRVSVWSPYSRNKVQNGVTRLAVFLFLSSSQKFAALRDAVPKVPGVSATV